MELNAGLRKSDNYSIKYSERTEYGRQFGEKIMKPEIVSPNLELMRSTMEYKLNWFHKRSKMEIAVISNLAREVFLRHRTSEPELVKLVISIYLYFIDYLHYLDIEKKYLFPVILNTLPRNNYLGIINSERKREIQETIANIRREQYYAMGKLRSLRKLTKNYLVPVNASKFRKLLFSKMKKFDKALVKYMHFQYTRIFPLVMGG